MPLKPSTQMLLILCATVPGVYLVLVALGRWLKRRLGVKLGAIYQLFSLALAFFLPLSFLEANIEVLQFLEASVVILGTLVLLSLIQRFFWELYVQDRRHLAVPKFVSDVAALALFAVAVILVLTFIYGVRIPGLLAGSGIVAVILGLAMQDLLSNIISGFSLHFAKPFAPGDWLIMDGRHAQVVEVNWRSTRLRTTDEVYIDIPNNQISKQQIVNLSYPNPLHAMRLAVAIDYQAAPNVVKESLMQAAVRAQGVLASPAPKVYLNSFGDSAIVYEIKFWMENHALYNDITDSIRTHVWYELQRRGIKIPYPIRTLQIERPSAKEPEAAALRAVFNKQPLFACLSDSERDRLLAQARRYRFGQGECLIEQGKPGNSMFILLQGEANVLVTKNSQPTVVAALRPGECFGEMSLLTGENRSATVLAQSDCEVMEIAKTSLAELIQSKPALADQLSALLARRQMQTQGILARSQPATHSAQQEREIAASFLDKLRSFFEL